jgi:arginine decarboxylase
MNSVFMPKTSKVQYLGFFNTGAYQEVLSGYGGIHHCLLPSPKHVIIRRNRDETFNFEVFGEEQNSKQVLKNSGLLIQPQRIRSFSQRAPGLYLVLFMF